MTRDFDPSVDPRVFGLLRGAFTEDALRSGGWFGIY